MAAYLRGIAIAVVLMAISGTAASAGVLTWSFNYSGIGVTASGILTTSDTPDLGFGPNAYDIVGISGVSNGVPITGIVPPSGVVTNNFGFLYDNVLYGTQPFFDMNGLLYSGFYGATPNVIFNVWYDASQQEYFEYTYQDGIYTVLTDGSIKQVPEPAPLALIGVGLLSLLGLGLLRKRADA